MKIKVAIKAVIKIERSGIGWPDHAETLHVIDRDLGVVEVEIPDDWLKIPNIIPNTKIRIMVKGEKTVG